MATDGEACAILRAERELQTLEILLEALQPSDVAQQLCDGALEAVRAALRERRAEANLPPEIEVAA